MKAALKKNDIIIFFGIHSLEGELAFLSMRKISNSRFYLTPNKIENIITFDHGK